MASSTSFEAVNNSSTRFHTQRINRRLDDRDNVIKEAIAVLEEKDRAVFPVAHKIVISHNSLTSLQNGQASQAISITVTGANFSTADSGDSMCSARLGDVAMVLDTSNNSATNAVFTLTTDALTAGNVLSFRMHSDEVLVCELFLVVS